MASRARRIKRVLVVDDQESWLRALERDAGSEIVVFTATDAAQARQVAEAEHPDLAIVDLRLGSDSGLQLVSDLRAQHKRMKIVLISSFMTIPATVAAMKAGADHVDTKPITCRQLIAKLEAGVPSDVAGTSSLARMEWEYVQRVLDECGGNRSQAARTLGIYRQSLQRMLRKHPPPT